MKTFRSWAFASWGMLFFVSALVRWGTISLAQLEFLSLCLFKRWTGLSCPGCGMAHALIAACLGQWTLSLHYHPLGIPFLIVWSGWLFCTAYRKAGLPGLQKPLLSVAIRSRIQITTLGLVMLVYLLRWFPV